MKTIKLVLSIVALTIASTASAQFANSTQSTSTKQSSTSTTTVDLSNWNSFYISVDTPVLVWDGDDEEKFNGGFSLGFTSTKVLSDSTPIFAESGVEFSYAYYNDDYDDCYYTYNFFNAVIPINLVYLYSINENFSVAPYVGLYARVGISFRNKYSYSYSSGEYSDSGSLYDEDYWGDDALNRLTYGYQLGVNLQLKDKYIVGIKWQNDINEMCEDLKYKNGISINLGFKF
ncbi:MAG: hypothetical protein SNG38_01880 [Rikenellaceae bacterium]